MIMDFPLRCKKGASYWEAPFNVYSVYDFYNIYNVYTVSCFNRYFLITKFIYPLIFK